MSLDSKGQKSVAVRSVTYDAEGALDTSTTPKNRDGVPVSFFVRLGDNDFDSATRSWRCPALDLPGSSVNDVYVRGSRIDKERYRIIENQSHIRWVDGEPPEYITVEVTVNAVQLTNLKQDKDAAQKSETWWRNFGITVPIIVALIAAAASWLAANSSPSTDVEPIIQIIAKIDANITSATNSIPDSCPGGKHGQTPANGPRTIQLLNEARTSLSQVRDQVSKLP